MGNVEAFLLVAISAPPIHPTPTNRLSPSPDLDEPLGLDSPTDQTPIGCQGRGFREQVRPLQTDGLGSITSLVSETSGFFRGLNLKERYTYDSFGSPRITGPGPDQIMDTGDDVTLPASALGNIYFFTGREYDSESGLYYYRARYYDPHLGRFLQEDPVMLSWMSAYPYVLNNPLRWVDPLGLSEEEIQQMYQWVVEHHPEVNQGVNPSFFEVDLPGDLLGLTLPFESILIDPDYRTRSNLVNTISHELLHAQKGFIGNIAEDVRTRGESHQRIYRAGDAIEADYLTWGRKEREREAQEAVEETYCPVGSGKE